MHGKIGKEIKTPEPRLIEVDMEKFESTFIYEEHGPHHLYIAMVQTISAKQELGLWMVVINGPDELTAGIRLRQLLETTLVPSPVALEVKVMKPLEAMLTDLRNYVDGFDKDAPTG